MPNMIHDSQRTRQAFQNKFHQLDMQHILAEALDSDLHLRKSSIMFHFHIQHIHPDIEGILQNPNSVYQDILKRMNFNTSMAKAQMSRMKNTHYLLVRNIHHSLHDKPNIKYQPLEYLHRMLGILHPTNKSSRASLHRGHKQYCHSRNTNSPGRPQEFDRYRRNTSRKCSLCSMSRISNLCNFRQCMDHSILLQRSQQYNLHRNRCSLLHHRRTHLYRTLFLKFMWTNYIYHNSQYSHLQRQGFPKDLKESLHYHIFESLS